jgi:hypothetical protein
MEPRTFTMMGKYFTTELHPCPPHFPFLTHQLSIFQTLLLLSKLNILV